MPRNLLTQFLLLLWNSMCLVQNLARYLVKWQSVGERLGKYGGWDKDSYPVLLNLFSVILATSIIMNKNYDQA